jgi:hypothetical protein
MQATNNNKIEIGPISSFFEVHQVLERFAVFRKVNQKTGRVTFVIAKRPSKLVLTEPPGSVLEEFGDEAHAISALNRWATDSRPPKPAPKLKKAGAYRRISNRPRRPVKVGTGQLELGLPPDIKS